MLPDGGVTNGSTSTNLHAGDFATRLSECRVLNYRLGTVRLWPRAARSAGRVGRCASVWGVG